MYGVKIDIPSGALSQETTITISEEENGSIVNIGPSGTIFNVPATVTIPYKDEANEKFLAVFSVDEEGANWTIYDNYIVDTVSNKAIFNVSHLSKFSVGIIIGPSEIRFFFKGGSKNLTDSENETAKATMRDVILNRPWKEFYDCAGKVVKEVLNESDANIIIEWGEIDVRNNARTYFDCHAVGGIPVCTPRSITLNERRDFHISLDKNIPSSKVDLYSVSAHELGHVLELREYYETTYPSNSVTDPAVVPGEYARDLQEIDRSRFKERHSECEEEECADIAGNWSGTVQVVGTCGGTPVNLSYPVVLTLSPIECSGNWEQEYSFDCGIGPGTQHLKEQSSYTIEGDIIRANINIIFDGDCYVNGCTPGVTPCHIWWHFDIPMSGEGTVENNTINFVLTGTTTGFSCGDLPPGCATGPCPFTDSWTLTRSSSTTSLKHPRRGILEKKQGG